MADKTTTDGGRLRRTGLRDGAGGDDDPWHIGPG